MRKWSQNEWTCIIFNSIDTHPCCFSMEDAVGHPFRFTSSFSCCPNAFMRCFNIPIAIQVPMAPFVACCVHELLLVSLCSFIGLRIVVLWCCPNHVVSCLRVPSCASSAAFSIVPMSFSGAFSFERNKHNCMFWCCTSLWIKRCALAIAACEAVFWDFSKLWFFGKGWQTADVLFGDADFEKSKRQHQGLQSHSFFFTWSCNPCTWTWNLQLRRLMPTGHLTKVWINQQPHFLLATPPERGAEEPTGCYKWCFREGSFQQHT